MEDLAEDLWEESEEEEFEESEEEESDEKARAWNMQALNLRAAIETTWADPKAPLEEIRVDAHERSAEPKGTTCPTCFKKFRTHKPSLNATAARGLVNLMLCYIRSGGEPVPIRVFHRERNAMADMKHWGLVEIAPNADPTKRSSSGRYSPTKRLIRWMRGEIRLPKFCRTVTVKSQRKFLAFEGAQTSFLSASFDIFDREEFLKQQDIMEKHYKLKSGQLVVVGKRDIPEPRFKEPKKKKGKK